MRSQGEIYKDACSLRDLKKLLKEGAVRLQVIHKSGCCTYYTAIHPCDCGAEERAQEVDKLLGIQEEREHVAT